MPTRHRSGCPEGASCRSGPFWHISSPSGESLLGPSYALATQPTFLRTTSITITNSGTGIKPRLGNLKTRPVAVGSSSDKSLAVFGKSLGSLYTSSKPSARRESRIPRRSSEETISNSSRSTTVTFPQNSEVKLNKRAAHTTLVRLPSTEQPGDFTHWFASIPCLAKRPSP